MGIIRKLTDAVKGKSKVAVQETQGQIYLNALCSNAENVFAQMRPLVDELKMVQPFGVGRNGAKLPSSRTPELLALQTPNEDMGWAEFADLMFSAWLTEKELNIHVWKNQRGKVYGYTVLPSNSRYTIGGEVRFRTALPDGTIVDLTRDEVMTLRFSRNPRNIDAGVSPGIASMVWAQIDDVMAQYQLAHFENGAVPAYITIIRASSREKYLAKRKEMEKGFHGASNKGKTLYLWRQFLDDGSERDEVEVKTIQGSNASLAIKDIMAIVNDKLNKSFGVSNFILGDDSSAKYDNAELSQQQFLSHRVYPALYTFWSQFQHELDRILGGLGYAISWELEIPELTDRLKVKAETKKVEAETANLRTTKAKIEAETCKVKDEIQKIKDEARKIRDEAHNVKANTLITLIKAGGKPEAVVAALELDENWLEVARTISKSGVSDKISTTSDDTMEDASDTTQALDQPPESQGWIGAKVESIEVSRYLSPNMKKQLWCGDLKEETTNIPGEENPHFTVIYGLTKAGFETPDVDITELCQEVVPHTVKISKITCFESDKDYRPIVAELAMTKELEKMRATFMELDHYEQEFPEYRPHITLCYASNDADIDRFIETFDNLIGREIKVIGYDIDNPWQPKSDHSCQNCRHTHDALEPVFSVDEVIEQQIYQELMKVIESAMAEVVGTGLVLSTEDLDKITSLIVEKLSEEANNGANAGAKEIQAIVLGKTGEEIAGILENGGYHLSEDFYRKLESRTEDLISRLSNDAKVKAQEVLNAAQPKTAAEIEKALAEVMPKQRAATIARNETIYAFRAGHLENDEYIAKKYNLKLRKIWRCHDGACDICKAMDGKEVALSEAFPDSVEGEDGILYAWEHDKWNDHGLITSAHVHCRCYFETIVEGYND